MNIMDLGSWLVIYGFGIMVLYLLLILVTDFISSCKETLEEHPKLAYLIFGVPALMILQGWILILAAWLLGW